MIDPRAVPVVYMRGNLVFSLRGEVSALYRLPTVAYGLLPDADKWGWLRALARFAFGAGADFSIWRVSRRYPAEDYVAQAEGLVDDRTQDLAVWQHWLEGHRARIEALDSHAPEAYLRISLRDGPTRGGLLGLDRARRRFEALAGVGRPEPVRGSELAALAEEERRLLGRVRHAFPAAQRATTRDLQWLARRAAVRHVAEPALDPWWRPSALMLATDDDVVYQPRTVDFLRLFNAPLQRQDDHLVVRGQEARTHQAMLTLGSLPDEAEFPGPETELLSWPLEAVGFPVDAVLHVRWIGNRKALSEVRKAIVDANNAIRDQVAGAQEPDERKLHNRDLARELEFELRSEARPPMLEASIGYAIGAASEAELRQRVTALREHLAGIAVFQPAGLQTGLYYDHLPRAAGGAVPDYEQTLTIEQFGALMPVGTNRAGHSRGAYIGHTAAGGARRPIKLDLTAPAADDLPTSIFMCGRQGSGKTFAAQLLALSAAMRGSYVLTVDPGPDHNLVALPELAGCSRTIALEASERCAGMLDPLIAVPPEYRQDIATSYLIEILPDDVPGQWEIEITGAVREALGSSDGLRGVLDRLAAGNQHAKDVARALGLSAQLGLGALAFGDGSGAEAAPELARVTTVTMPGLELPPAAVPRSSYERSDRLAVATFQLLAANIMWLATRDRGAHKVVVLDEAWTFLGTPSGLRLLHKLIRLGRKLNVTVILISQTAGDLGELDELIGMRFAFGQNSESAARRALVLQRMDPDDEALVHALCDTQVFARGRCLMRDQAGDVADVQIDPVYSHVHDVLMTTPGARRAIAA